MMNTWVADEMRSARLRDKRLERRLATLIDTLSARPTDSIPTACGSWASTKAAYRFFDNDKVTAEAIYSAHRSRAIQRAEGLPLVLAIQDTTPLDFSGHRASKGLGPIGTWENHGLMVHSLLLTSAQGSPLGVLDQKVWARDKQTRGKSKSCRSRPIKEKESYKWLEGLTSVKSFLPKQQSVVLIGDRESDLYELFIEERPQNVDLLVRACYNRVIEEEAHLLYESLAKAPVVGTKTIVAARADGRPAREAILCVRFVNVTLKPPNYHKNVAAAPICAVMVEEQDPPTGIEPLRWVLLTTCRVDTLEAACLLVDWYSYRWRIERFHFVLKSGCQIEQLQLQDADRIKVALAVYCVVAWRLMDITEASRRTPEQPCDTYLQQHEWKALCCTIQKTSSAPKDPPTLRQAVRWIAQLGGFLARTGDGEPGLKTVWRGLMRLDDIASTWALLNQPSCG